MRKALLGFALAAAFVTTPALAQEGVGPSAGDWEIQLGGSGSNDNDFSTSQFNADVTLGYYFDRNWEGVLRQTVDYSDSSGSALAGSTRAGIAYNFDGFGEVRPFLGADLGYVYGDNVADEWVAAGTAGAKWYVKPETFIFGRADYEWFFDEGDADDNFDDGRFIYTVGIGFNF
jgi:hypothetical protein